MPDSRRCWRRIAPSSRGGPRSKPSRAIGWPARGTVFEDALRSAPEYASAHVGLANACVMQFEMTRADPAPDVAALALAAHHAREACRLDPQSGEAWATLGFVLDRTGDRLDARAAATRAVTLEPDNWRHHFRLSYVSWGEERLRAAHQTLDAAAGFPARALARRHGPRGAAGAGRGRARARGGPRAPGRPADAAARGSAPWRCTGCSASSIWRAATRRARSRSSSAS